MTTNEFGQLITILGSSTAAGTGIWNVWYQMRGKYDKFIVGLDSIEPTIEQETMIHVVSLSDHPIKLKDWGFIESDGKFFSFRLAWDAGAIRSEEILSRGEPILGERNATFETGLVLKQRPLGA